MPCSAAVLIWSKSSLSSSLSLSLFLFLPSDLYSYVVDTVTTVGEVRHSQLDLLSVGVKPPEGRCQDDIIWSWCDGPPPFFRNDCFSLTWATSFPAFSNCPSSLSNMCKPLRAFRPNSESSDPRSRPYLAVVSCLYSEFIISLDCIYTALYMFKFWFYLVKN